MISEDGVSPVPSKVEAIKQIPAPHCVKDVRSFLGLSGYYRRFIKDYASISAPLTKLTTKESTKKSHGPKNVKTLLLLLSRLCVNRRC